MKEIPLVHEPVKFFADFQLEWFKIIDPLRRGKYSVQSTSELSIQGDAPKCFLRIKEYRRGRRTDRPGKWPKYIAKVGSKWYPLESITEHLITRIGQTCGFAVAESKLRMVGKQVRFLSRFFLRKGESLTHGIEIFQEDFGDEIVKDIAAEKMEKEFYTFSIVISSLERAFPEHAATITQDFVKMLVFDAVIGNNDRHPANWGVITSLEERVPPRFSPIFDTARGMFWNLSEVKVRDQLANSEHLESYVKRSGPQVGWEGKMKLNHFDLISLINGEYPRFRRTLRNAMQLVKPDACARMIREEFHELLSKDRITLIIKCLCLRQRKICDAIGVASNE